MTLDSLHDQTSEHTVHTHIEEEDVENLASSKGLEKNSTPTPPLIEYDNPRQWSIFRKIQTTFIVCFMALALAFSSSAFTSSTIHLVEQFKVSEEVVILGVALYVIGFASGPLLFAPAAQVFGHRPVYIATFLAFTGFSFGVSEAKNIGTILVCRFLAAFFGSSVFSNAPATIGDIITPRNAFRYMIWYGIALFGGPLLGPLVGAFVDYRAGWRWNLRVQASFIALSTILCIFFLPETNHIILQENAKETSKSLDGVIIKPSAMDKIKLVIQKYKVYALQPFVALFTEPVVLSISIYLGILYAVLYLTFEVVPLTFIGIRHFSEELNGLVYISSLIGVMIASVVMVYCQEKYTTEALATLQPGQRPPPEIRLRQAVWAAIFVPIGLFIYAWTAPFPHVHWIAPMIGLMVAYFGIFIVFTSFVPYLVEYGGVRAPIVMAGQTALRCAFGAGFPLFGRQMYDKLTLQGGTSLLAGISLAITPLSFLFYRYGAKLRSMNWAKTM